MEKLKFSVLKLSKEEKNFHLFTGISMQTFRDVLAILGDSVHSMMYSADVPDDHEGKQRSQRSRALSVEDELLMTLVELRHDFPESDLAARFGISQPTVSRIFSAWIRCMYHAFREIDIWPSRSLVDTFMLDSFRQKYPSTRVIIDATEFHIEKPANPDVQASTWSNYKNTNTLKLLVGVTPNAVISFLSSLWGGRISDKELTKRSKLLEKLERGDSIMADRGFDIGSIMPEGTNVNIPPFLGGRPQFEADELVVTRRIASLRIHVERAMELIKNFHITHYIPANFCPLAQPIVHVCAFLTIFLSPLVPTPLHPSMILFASPASSALACVAVASTSPLACSPAVASGPESTALSSIPPPPPPPQTSCQLLVLPQPSLCRKVYHSCKRHGCKHPSPCHQEKDQHSMTVSVSNVHVLSLLFCGYARLANGVIITCARAWTKKDVCVIIALCADDIFFSFLPCCETECIVHSQYGAFGTCMVNSNLVIFCLSAQHVFVCFLDM